MKTATPLSCIQMMKCVEKSVAVTIRRPNCFESWKAQIYCEGTDKVNAENSDTKTRETGVYECGKSACNKTDHNQIEDSHIYQSINYNQAEEQIKDQIEYTILTERYSEGVLQEIVHLLADTLCSGKEQIRIGQRSIPLSTSNWSEKYSVEHIYSTNILTYCRTYRVRY